MIHVVNMIPNSLSGEDNQDSEANLAVNPERPTDMVGTAFTPALGGNFAPIYVSTDGGWSWDLRNVVPGNGSAGTSDITVGFATSGGTLYAGTLHGVTHNLQLLRATDFTSTTPMTILVDRGGEDQPWVIAGTVESGVNAGKDRVYVGSNRYGQNKSATVDRSLDASTKSPPAGFSPFTVERRSTAGQDGPAIRLAVNADGTVYAAFQHYLTMTERAPLDITLDVVVCRDDNWGEGTSPFQDLKDSDGVAGERVATNRFVRFNDSMGQERLGSDLTIACDPRHSDDVWIGWCDRAGRESGTDWTLHVRHSTNRGQSWSGDLRTIVNTKNPSLAIDTDGRVGLLHQQLSGSKWITALEITNDGWATPATTFILHSAFSTQPTMDFWPYIGDYTRLLTVGRHFYGVFCGNNRADPANFPSSIRYQRNVDWESKTLLNIDNSTGVPSSIDPFFVDWSDDAEVAAGILLL